MTESTPKPREVPPPVRINPEVFTTVVKESEPTSVRSARVDGKG
jgi:hypothetical protein